MQRAIAFRVARGEWPPLATPAQHAAWAAEIGALDLASEGRRLVALDAEEGELDGRRL